MGKYCAIERRYGIFFVTEIQPIFHGTRLHYFQLCACSFISVRFIVFTRFSEKNIFFVRFERVNEYFYWLLLHRIVSVFILFSVVFHYTHRISFYFIFTRIRIKCAGTACSCGVCRDVFFYCLKFIWPP